MARSDSELSLGEAYRTLFKAVRKHYGWKWESLAQKFEEAARERCPLCSFSPSMLHRYGRGDIPGPDRAEHLYYCLSHWLKNKGIEDHYTNELKRISPDEIVRPRRAKRRIGITLVEASGDQAAQASQFPAIDMTSLLAAESFLAKRCQGFDAGTTVEDPKSRECFCDLVDLFVNSETLSLTLPLRSKETSEKMYPLAQFLDGKTATLADAALREPSDELEQTIQRGFFELIGNKNNDWITPWAKFQLTNPIVWRTHSLRLTDPTIAREKRVTINSGSIKRWNPEDRLFPMFDFNLPDELLDQTKEERSIFRSLSEFVACYVYDVYRRGWMYLQHVSSPANRGVYFPHPLRNTVLNLQSNWKRVSVAQIRNSFWSWGRLLAEVLRDPEAKPITSAENIIELIATIRDEVQAHELTWHQVAARNISDLEIGFIIEKLKKIAKGRCKIRLMRIYDQPDPLQAMVRSCATERLSLSGLFKDRVSYEDGLPEGMSPYACRGFFSESSPYRSDF